MIFKRLPKQSSLWFTILFLMLCWFGSCTDNSNLAGSETETIKQFIPLGLYGKVQMPDGNPAVNAKVILLKAPDNRTVSDSANEIHTSDLLSIDTAFTDSNGFFSFADQTKAIYVAFASSNDRSSAAVSAAIIYPDDNKIQRIDPLTLKPAGRISG